METLKEVRSPGRTTDATGDAGVSPAGKAYALENTAMDTHTVRNKLPESTYSPETASRQ